MQIVVVLVVVLVRNSALVLFLQSVPVALLVQRTVFLVLHLQKLLLVSLVVLVNFVLM